MVIPKCSICYENFINTNDFVIYNYCGMEFKIYYYSDKNISIKIEKHNKITNDKITIKTNKTFTYIEDDRYMNKSKYCYTCLFKININDKKDIIEGILNTCNKNFIYIINYDINS